MIFRIIAALVTATGLLLLLASCGGGGGGMSAATGRTPPTTTPTPPVTVSDYSSATGTPLSSGGFGVSHEPLNTDPTGAVGFVGGVDITALWQHLDGNPALISSSRQDSPRAEAWQVRLRDGVSRNQLVSYLRADAADHNRDYVERWRSPPTVRLAHGTSALDEQDTKNAIRLLNSALPPNWQIRFSDQRTSASVGRRPGEIVVAFEPQRNWPANIRSRDALGIASWARNDDGTIRSGVVFIDYTAISTERANVYVILHEVLHTLGRGHVSASQFPETVMRPVLDEGDDHLVLYRLDTDALLAIHGRLTPGTRSADIYTALGPWSDVSNHIVGRIGRVPGRQEAVLYGAVERNGLVRPWASAINPSPPMRQQLGSASWAGRMLGLTPGSQAVSGDVGMTVQLQSLTGALAFTAMEMWGAGQQVGEIGTGSTWGDGDLHYDIAVIENVFYETGGDAGKITGVFYGQNHDNVGGTLRRTDLAAGFGAELQR